MRHWDPDSEGDPAHFPSQSESTSFHPACFVPRRVKVRPFTLQVLCLPYCRYIHSGGETLLSQMISSLYFNQSSRSCHLTLLMTCPRSLAKEYTKSNNHVFKWSHSRLNFWIGSFNYESNPSALSLIIMKTFWSSICNFYDELKCWTVTKELQNIVQRWSGSNC